MAILFASTPFMLTLLASLLKIRLKGHYLFWIFSVIYFGLFYFLPTLNYGNSGFKNINLSASTLGPINDTDLVLSLYIFLTLFYLMLLVGYIGFRSKEIPLSFYHQKENSFHALIFWGSVFSIVGSLGAIYFSGMSIQQLTSSNRFDYWETKSTFSYLLSGYLQTLLVVPMFLIHYSKKKTFVFLALASLTLLFFVDMMIFGSRSTFMATGAAYVFGLISYYRSLGKRLNVKKILLFGFIVLHFAVVWQYVRYSMRSFQSTGDWIKAIFNFKEAYSHSFLQGDLAYFFASALTSFQVVPATHDYLYGSTYFRVLLFFVPSSVVPVKPEETQRVFASMINPSAYELGATFPPSMIGDSYINFGFFGVLVGALLGLFLRYWQTAMNGPMSISKITLGSSGFLFLFLFVRGTFNGMYTMIFVGLFVLSMTVLSKRTVTKRIVLKRKDAH